MNEQATIDRAGQLIGETIRLLIAAWPMAVLYLVVATGFEWLTDQTGALVGGGLMLDLVLSYALIIAMLRGGGLAPGGLKGSFVSYLLVWLLCFLAIIAGLVIFIIPGVILWVRWMPVFGYALVHNPDIAGALRSAWDATRGHFWPIVIACLFFAVPAAAASVITVFAVEAGPDVFFSSLLFVSGLTTITQIALTALGIAVFSLTNSHAAGIAEAFE
ncbi:MAG: hypothetical protein ACXIT4_10860 [Erythrobacter sp.]